MTNSSLNKNIKIMKQIITIILTYVLLLSCTASTLPKDINLCNDTPPSFEHYKTDTIGYNKYQTFDEFLMHGNGKALVEPFVWVKRIKDTIIVKSSSSIDSMRVYYKLPCGTWYNHIEYEMWKKDNYQITKSKWDKFARTYDRYFYNDTILEIRNVFVGTKEPSSTAIVKTRNTVLTITPFDKNNFCKKLRNKIHNMIKEDSVNLISQFSVIEKHDSIFYVQGSNKYSFKKNSLGLWGIQPGIDETCIYSGQDIRNFTQSHPNGIVLDNDTAVYELADQMPMYPGGIEEFTKISHVTVQKKIPSENNRIRIIVECIVEKDGGLSNFRIKKGFHSEYNKKALDIVTSINRFTPAVLNGEKVRCKILIPITFLLN